MNHHQIDMSSQMGKIVVSIELEQENDLDMVAFKMLKNDCPPFIAGFSSMEINGKTTLRYEVGNLISLTYFSAKLSIGEFTTIWDNLLAPLQMCKNWLLRYDCFCFNPQFVFIDRHSWEIKYIYLPMDSTVTSEDEIKALFMGLLECCELVDGQALQIELYKLFAQHGFALEELQSIITQYRKARPAAAAPISPPPPRIPTAPTSMPIPPVPPVPPIRAAAVTAPPPIVLKPAAIQPAGQWTPQDNINLTPEERLERELMDNLIKHKASKPPKQDKTPKTPKPAKAKKPFFLFGKSAEPPRSAESLNASREILCGAPESYSGVIPPSSSCTPVVMMAAEDDRTEMLDDNGDVGCCLHLVNQTAAPEVPRKIPLDFSKGSVLVGRYDANKGVQSDFEFPSSVKLVSRIHARLEARVDGYYIIDLQSTNGTYVNGSRIATNIAAPIKNGDRVSFSDKGMDYIFNT